MPPWKAAPADDGNGGEAFLDVRRLTDREIALIRDWVAGGAVEGDRVRVTGGSRSNARGPEWHLGAPDLIVEMGSPYVLAADGQDVFRTFVIPIPTDRARFVRGLEFRPGNARVVHHANIGVDRTQSSRRLDAADPAPGYVGGMVPDASYPPGYMLGWTPGQRPRPSPDGMPWRLEAASDLVVQLHLQPTGKPEPLQVSVALFFTDELPTAAPIGLRLGSQTIDIPAGRRRLSDHRQLPPARGRRSPGAAAARPQPGPPHRRGSSSTKRHDAQPHHDRRLGFPVAGRVPLCTAHRAAGGDDDRHALYLRQQRRERSQPQSSARPRGVGAEHVERDGRSLAAARAAAS